MTVCDICVLYVAKIPVNIPLILVPERFNRYVPLSLQLSNCFIHSEVVIHAPTYMMDIDLA